MSYFLRSRAAVKSLSCSVKAHVGMEPHARTPSPPVLSPAVTAATEVHNVMNIYMW